MCILSPTRQLVWLWV